MQFFFCSHEGFAQKINLSLYGLVYETFQFDVIQLNLSQTDSLFGRN